MFLKLQVHPAQPRHGTVNKEFIAEHKRWQHMRHVPSRQTAAAVWQAVGAAAATVGCTNATTAWPMATTARPTHTSSGGPVSTALATSIDCAALLVAGLARLDAHPPLERPHSLAEAVKKPLVRTVYGVEENKEEQGARRVLGLLPGVLEQQGHQRLLVVVTSLEIDRHVDAARAKRG